MIARPERYEAWRGIVSTIYRIERGWVTSWVRQDVSVGGRIDYYTAPGSDLSLADAIDAVLEYEDAQGEEELLPALCRHGLDGEEAEEWLGPWTSLVHLTDILGARARGWTSDEVRDAFDAGDGAIYSGLPPRLRTSTIYEHLAEAAQ